MNHKHKNPTCHLKCTEDRCQNYIWLDFLLHALMSQNVFTGDFDIVRRYQSFLNPHLLLGASEHLVFSPPMASRGHDPLWFLQWRHNKPPPYDVTTHPCRMTLQNASVLWRHNTPVWCHSTFLPYDVATRLCRMTSQYPLPLDVIIRPALWRHHISLRSETFFELWLGTHCLDHARENV